MAKNIKFENAINRLREIVETLEEGSLDIDESLKLYEEGVNLTKKCSKKLEDIENKINILQQSTEENNEE